MKHLGILFLCVCFSLVGMEQDADLSVVLSDTELDQKIIDSFVRHVVTENFGFVQKYLKNKISPSALNLCLQQTPINVNILLSKSPRREWWEVALRAKNIENFAVITSRLNRFAINRALSATIMQNKPQYVAVCLQNPQLIKPLNFDHTTEYGKKLIEKIVHHPTAQLAQLIIPETKPHFAIALLNRVFDLATKRLTVQYKEMMQLCFMQANIADRLGAEGADMMSKLWNAYAQVRISKIDIELHMLNQRDLLSEFFLPPIDQAEIQHQRRLLEHENTLWHELSFKD